jgi:hypothetical protein
MHDATARLDVGLGRTALTSLAHDLKTRTPRNWSVRMSYEPPFIWRQGSRCRVLFKRPDVIDRLNPISSKVHVTLNLLISNSGASRFGTQSSRCRIIYIVASRSQYTRPKRNAGTGLMSDPLDYESISSSRLRGPRSSSIGCAITTLISAFIVVIMVIALLRLVYIERHSPPMGGPDMTGAIVELVCLLALIICMMSGVWGILAAKRDESAVRRLCVAGIIIAVVFGILGSAIVFH